MKNQFRHRYKIYHDPFQSKQFRFKKAMVNDLLESIRTADKFDALGNASYTYAVLMLDDLYPNRFRS